MYIKRLLFIIAIYWQGVGLCQSLGYLRQDNPYDSSTSQLPIFPALDHRPIHGKFLRHQPLIDLALQAHTSAQGKIRGGYLVDFEKSAFFMRLSAFVGAYSNHSVFNQNGLSLKNVFLQWDPSIRLGVKPSRYFNAQLGYDRNFYGEGARSLFISDFGKPYPFISSRFNIGPLSYQAMLSYLGNNSLQKKFFMTHFLHGSIGKRVDLQFFEAVIFNSGDTLTHRSFDPAYLNPFVIIRPLEYSLGSGDNVLIGLGAAFKFHANSKIYGQFLLDDFLLSALLNKSKYWANKFAGQLGWKYRFSSNLLRYSLRIEANAVRPYTYSHLGEPLSYSNGSQVLAHPLGANFWEVLTQFKVSKKRGAIFGEVQLGAQGRDSSSINYGSNIFLPYTNRPSDYGVSLLQGQKTSFIKGRINFSYSLRRFFFSEIYCELFMVYLHNQQQNQFKLSPILGIRSPLFNDYRF